MTTANSAESWRPLSMIQRRCLGVLVEKAKTTPDAYPLSLNSLTTGANQKSNRDPIMNVTDDDVETNLAEMQKLGLVTRIQGGRVERWRHNLYDLWKVDKIELAVLAELLLRGAQTEGELRQRASRMEPIDDIELLRQKLKPLAERKLVVFLGEEGRRGTQIMHGFHVPGELDRIRSAIRYEDAPSAPTPAAPARAPEGPHPLEAKVSQLEAEIAALRAQFNELAATTRQLDYAVRSLKDSLGG